MPITADIQGLEVGRLIELIEVDASALGAEVYRFHADLQVESVWWQGLEYRRWPYSTDGFEMSGGSKQPTPTLTLGNVDGFVTSLVIYFQDLVGSVVTRRRTLSKYLDARNFPAGNPTADPEEELPPDVWYIEQKTGENEETVQFELSSALNFAGQQLPRGQIIANTCRWLTIGGYRGPYCGYNGPPVANEFDIITTDAARDQCGGLPKSCKLRFGANEELPYGSYPAAGLIR